MPMDMKSGYGKAMTKSESDRSGKEDSDMYTRSLKMPATPRPAQMQMGRGKRKMKR